MRVTRLCPFLCERSLSKTSKIRTNSSVKKSFRIPVNRGFNDGTNSLPHHYGANYWARCGRYRRASRKRGVKPPVMVLSLRSVRAKSNRFCPRGTFCSTTWPGMTHCSGLPSIRIHKRCEASISGISVDKKRQLPTGCLNPRAGLLTR